MAELLLAGDVGGTKTALAIYSWHDDLPQLIVQGIFQNKEYHSIEEIVRLFLAHHQLSVTHASIAVAGPIINQRAQITNLPWVTDAHQLSRSLQGIPVYLLNDLEAIASAIPFLQSRDWETLNEGESIEHGARAIIAPGTGLGEAFLIWNGLRYRAYPSEGGHADFAPTTSIECELLCYLQKQMSHVSYERVASGIGLPNLFAFFKDVKHLNVPDGLAQSLATSTDPTPVLVQAALDHQIEICVATLKLFISILASEAGNLALKTLATGGVYLGGGIPLRILPYLRDEMFVQRFSDKGRFTEFLQRIPIHVVTHPYSGVLGAACYAWENRKSM